MADETPDSDKIPYDPKNIAFIAGWRDVRDVDTKLGYTLVTNIDDLVGPFTGRPQSVKQPEKKLPPDSLWIEYPQMMQFVDLERFLKGETQAYVSSIDMLPDFRKVTESEQKMLFEIYRAEISKYDAKTQAEVLLPMFYRS